VATVLLIGGLLVPVVAASVARHRATVAADAAALAAADALVGIVRGDACARAAEVAAADGASLERCVVDGLVATVRVEARAALLAVEASATAGPPG